VINGHAKGIVVRNLITGQLESIRPMPWCWPPADTAMSFSFPPMPWDPM
jgi:hypothetical protein